MAGREVKGWVVPQPLGVALLVVLLGAVGWAYKSSTADQRETLISITRIETMLDERTKTFKEQQAELKAEMKDEHAVAALQREQQDKELRSMKAALEQKGIKLPQKSQ